MSSQSDCSKQYKTIQNNTKQYKTKQNNTKNLWVGSLIDSGKNAEIRVGHALPLSSIPVGSLEHNLSVSLKKKGQMARSAGTHAQLIQKTKNYGRVRLPSGEQRLIPLDCFATLGVVVMNLVAWFFWGRRVELIGKNRRAHVRGVAMNPVDHTKLQNNTIIIQYNI